MRTPLVFIEKSYAWDQLSNFTGFLPVKMVRDIDHMVNYIIKFVIPTRLTNRELEIITAGLQLRFRIGSRHWKKSARIIQKIPSLSYYPSKPIFTRPPHLNHFCLVQISFNACRIMNIHKKTTFIFYPYFYRNIQLGILSRTKVYRQDYNQAVN